MGTGESADGYGRPGAPLKSYAVLVALYNGLFGAFLWWAKRSGRLPKRVAPGDIVLLGVATQKVSRLLTKDKVTSVLRSPFVAFEEMGDGNEVNERPRGDGARRAIGELLTCPFCLDQWVGAALAAGFVVVPRLARFVAALFAAVALADGLHWLSEGLRKAAKGDE